MKTTDYAISTDARHNTIRIRSRGRAVLANSMTNRGTAFTLVERDQLDLTGLLPSGVNTLDEQVCAPTSSTAASTPGSARTASCRTCGTATRCCSTGC